MLNSCVMHRHTGPAPDIMVWGGIGYYSRTPIVRIAGLGHSHISTVNALPHMTRIVQRFFVNHQIELLPWSARSLDLSLIVNMWYMVAQRLTQITPPAATPDQLWQRVEAAWSAVPRMEFSSKTKPRAVHPELSVVGKRRPMDPSQTLYFIESELNSSSMGLSG
ncbi:transposable element Tcb1 transposase [Trichonephila clavipes]|nr:transposable element Tcb1 transposase [Trichonephila clavipes]